jgi:hypothetical protein
MNHSKPDSPQQNPSSSSSKGGKALDLTSVGKLLVGAAVMAVEKLIQKVSESKVVKTAESSGRNVPSVKRSKSRASKKIRAGKPARKSKGARKAIARKTSRS